MDLDNSSEKNESSYGAIARKLAQQRAHELASKELPPSRSVDAHGDGSSPRQNPAEPLTAQVPSAKPPKSKAEEGPRVIYATLPLPDFLQPMPNMQPLSWTLRIYALIFKMIGIVATTIYFYAVSDSRRAIRSGVVDSIGFLALGALLFSLFLIGGGLHRGKRWAVLAVGFWCVLGTAAMGLRTWAHGFETSLIGWVLLILILVPPFVKGIEHYGDLT